MCGIAFCIGSVSGLAEAVQSMATMLGHRGPDDEGVWVDEEAGVALSQMRLSILDLSPAGHQPMLSHCRRYVTVFNVEIYNHLELRCELEREALASAGSSVRSGGEMAPQPQNLLWMERGRWRGGR